MWIPLVDKKTLVIAIAVLAILGVLFFSGTFQGGFGGAPGMASYGGGNSYGGGATIATPSAGGGKGGTDWGGMMLPYLPYVAVGGGGIFAAHKYRHKLKNPLRGRKILSNIKPWLRSTQTQPQHTASTPVQPGNSSQSALGHHYLLTLNPINLSQPDENGVYTAKTGNDAYFEALLLIDGKKGAYKKIEVELEGPVKRKEEISSTDWIKIPVKKHKHTLKARLTYIDYKYVNFPVASTATIVGKDDFDAGDYSVTTTLEYGSAYNSMFKGFFAAANEINGVHGRVLKKDGSKEKGVDGVNVEYSGATKGADATSQDGFTAHTYFPKEGKQTLTVTYRIHTNEIAAHTLDIFGQRLWNIELWISDPAQNDRVYLPYEKGWKSVKKEDIIKKLQEDITDYQQVSKLEFATRTKLKAYVVLRNEKAERPLNGILYGSRPTCKMRTKDWDSMSYNQSWNLYQMDFELAGWQTDHHISAYLETNFGTYATQEVVITGKDTFTSKMIQSLPPPKHLRLQATLFKGDSEIAKTQQEVRPDERMFSADAPTGDTLKLVVELFYKKGRVPTKEYGAFLDKSRDKFLPEDNRFKERYQYKIPVEDGSHLYYLSIVYEKQRIGYYFVIIGTSKKAGHTAIPASPKQQALPKKSSEEPETTLRVLLTADKNIIASNHQAGADHANKGYQYVLDAKANAGDRLELFVDLWQGAGHIPITGYTPEIMRLSDEMPLKERSGKQNAHLYWIEVGAGLSEYRIEVVHEKKQHTCLVSITGTSKKHNKANRLEEEHKLRSVAIEGIEPTSRRRAGNNIIIHEYAIEAGKDITILARYKKGGEDHPPKRKGHFMVTGGKDRYEEIEITDGECRIPYTVQPTYQIINVIPDEDNDALQNWKLGITGDRQKKEEGTITIEDNDLPPFKKRFEKEEGTITIEDNDLLPFKIELFPTESKNAITEKGEGVYETAKNNELWIRVTLDEKALKEYKREYLTILHNTKKYLREILDEQIIVQKIVVSKGENKIKVSLGTRKTQIVIIGA